jgi:hypothetical protein
VKEQTVNGHRAEHSESVGDREQSMSARNYEIGKEIWGERQQRKKQNKNIKFAYSFNTNKASHKNTGFVTLHVINDPGGGGGGISGFFFSV